MGKVFSNIKKINLFLLAAILTFTYSFHSINAARPSKSEYLKSGLTYDISSINGKVKLFKDLKALPASSLDEITLTSKVGGKTIKIGSYKRNELWLRDQMAGSWGNNLCRITVYKMSNPLPLDVPVAYKDKRSNTVLVTKVDYDNWVQKKQNEKREWSDEAIAEWLQFITGLNFQLPPETLKRGGPKNSTTKCFKPKSGAENGIMYVMTNPFNDSELVAIHYQLAKAEEKEHKKNLKAVASSLASVAFYKPKKSKEKSKEKVFTSYKYKKKNIERTPEYKASRAAVKKSIQNLPDWWFLETDNFVMVANIENNKTALELSKNLEKSREVFEQYYPIKEPLKAVSVARMFETREEYVSFVGKSLQWSGGVWMSSKKELVISPMNWGSKVERRKMMIETTFHEAFHQYIFFAAGQTETSAWFNEGNAQYFEEIKFRGGNYIIDINERAVESMKKLTSLNQIQNMIDISYKKFYGRGRENNYTLAWGLMFFLQKGAPVMRKKNNYHEIPTKYYEAILENNAETANKVAWEGVDIEQFADDFKEFWNSKSLIKNAVNYNPGKN